ncbi:cytochrome P450 [Tanacetum coccineum]
MMNRSCSPIRSVVLICCLSMFPDFGEFKFNIVKGDFKVKKAKTSQTDKKTEKTITGERFEANIKPIPARQQEKKVNEVPIEDKRIIKNKDYREKKKLWKELSQVITFHNTFTILLGDFNEVRSKSERMGTIFDPRGAAKFNDFITIADLCDLPMGGKWFTRMNNLGSKLSKIDRVLVSNHVIQRWPNSYVFALPREFCNHTPLLLKNLTVDYVPTPFKLYNSWIDHTGFLSLVQNSWSSVVNGPPLVNIRDKGDGIDNKAESHPLNFEEIDDRIQWVKLLANFEHQKVKDLRQKAKLKWALEGDENSQFFHGIINNRRNRARINGLNIQIL